MTTIIVCMTLRPVFRAWKRRLKFSASLHMYLALVNISVQIHIIAFDALKTKKKIFHFKIFILYS